MWIPNVKWCAGLLILSASPVAAQPTKAEPKSVLSRILAMKPVPVQEDDTPLIKLQRERFNARLTAAQAQAQAVQAGAAAPQDLAELVKRLGGDGADMEAKPADRTKWLQLRVDALREYEQQARSRVQAGGISPVVVNLAIAARADAEIDLLRLKESLKNGE